MVVKSGNTARQVIMGVGNRVLEVHLMGFFQKKGRRFWRWRDERIMGILAIGHVHTSFRCPHLSFIAALLTL
jgi:hypothetical protein